MQNLSNSINKCIICLLNENKENKLTDEHVIPEFMGGNFFLKNVCKICNSNMGKEFEGRLANHLLFIFNRQNNEIIGKKNYTKNPLAGTYKSEDDTKYLLDQDLNIIIPEKFIINKNENNTYTVTFTKLTDEISDKSKMLDEIKEYALSKIKKQDPTIERIEINLENEDTSAIGSIKSIKCFTLSEEDLKLLALKICYEMYIYILVKKNKIKLINSCFSLESSKFNTIRDFLKNCKINIKESDKIINFLNKEEDKIFNNVKKNFANSDIDTENNYVIYFTPSFCVVKFLIFSFMIKADFSIKHVLSIYRPDNQKLTIQSIHRNKLEADLFFKNEELYELNEKQIINNMILLKLF